MLSQIRYIKKKNCNVFSKVCQGWVTYYEIITKPFKKIESHELLDICTIANVDKCMYIPSHKINDFGDNQKL